MPLRIKCPTGHTLIVPDDRAGRTLRCPRCSQSFTVPGEGKESGVGSQESGVRGQGSAIGKLMAVAAKAVGGSGTTKMAKPAVKAPSAKGQPVVKPKSRALTLAEKPVEVRRGTPDPAAGDLRSKAGAGSGDPRTTPEPVAKAPELPQFEPEPPPVVGAPAVAGTSDFAAALPMAVVPPPVVSEQVEAPPVIAPSAPPAVEPPPVLKTLEAPVEPEVSPSVPPPAAQQELRPPKEDDRKKAAALQEVAPSKEAEPVAAEAIVEPPPPEAPVTETIPEPPAEVAAALAEPEAPAIPEPTPPPPVAEAKAPPVTVELAADRSKVLVVYQLAAALIAAALLSVAPAVWDVVEYIQFYDMVDDPHVARWALVLFFLGIVQLAYAVYLFQLPDWTSVWVVTMYSLLMAAIYAATLGMVLISREDGGIVAGLQLADKLTGGKAALWCLCMVSVSTMLAFFAGRLSVRWHKAEMLLRSAGV